MRPKTARPAAVAAALLLPVLLPAAALAQGGRVATITLTKPEVEYEEPFTYVSGVRELRDGRVVVSDMQEKTIQLLDLRSGSAKRIGKEGSGPNEYARPGQVYALPGDTTLVSDMGNNRYLVVGPDGEVARTLHVMDPNEPDMRLIGQARASDASGNLYFLDRGLAARLERRAGGEGGGPPDLPDSGTVLRYDLRTKKVTEIGKVALPKTNTTSSGGGGQVSVMRMAVPFSAQDDWTVGTDGRIAVVRAEPYRVEWVAPNGQRVTGPSIAYEKIRVTEQDKENFRNARLTMAGTNMRVTIGGPGGGVSTATAPPPTTTRPPEPTSWPEFKPAFYGNQSVVAPDGRLWVSRHRPADDTKPKYDVFDSFGRLVARAELPANTRLVGFGARTAYLVRTDADDLQYLQRYALP